MIFQSYADHEAGRAKAGPLARLLNDARRYSERARVTTNLLTGWLDAYDAWHDMAIDCHNELEAGATGFNAATLSERMAHCVAQANHCRASVLALAWRQREIGERGKLIELIDARYPPLFISTEI
jgi:hypothetical protein